MKSSIAGCLLMLHLLLLTVAPVNHAQPQAERGTRAQQQKPLRLIFITTCMESKFFEPVRKGMEDAAAMLGVTSSFIGTPGVDIPAQVAMIRRAMNDGYDGIAVDIIDPVAFDAVVQEAITKGIPVVAFNTDDDATPNARLSAVCQRLHDAGRRLATKAMDFIPAGSRALVTMHDEGVSALQDRLHGIQEVLRQHDVTWKVVVTGNTAEHAALVVSQELKANPDITAVLCTGQADTEGAGKAIEGGFRGRKAAGFDVSPGILRLIKAGHIRFSIDQQPYVQGFYPVVQLVQFCRYGIMPSNIDAGAGIIDTSNVEGITTLAEQHYR